MALYEFCIVFYCIVTVCGVFIASQSLAGVIIISSSSFYLPNNTMTRTSSFITQQLDEKQQLYCNSSLDQSVHISNIAKRKDAG